MKTAAIALAALSVASAATAASARPEQISDVDFVQASHCAGLAAALKAPEAADLGAYVKAQEGYRMPFVVQQGQEAFDAASRSVRPERKARAEAELAGACAAYRPAAMHAQAPGVSNVIAR